MIQRTDEETRRLFDEWAATYENDLVDAASPLEGYRQSLETAASLLAIPERPTVLDVGVGTGAFAALVAANRPHAAVTGIDVSAEMLDQCRQRHPDWTLDQAGFERIPAGDAVFNLAISAFAFHEVAPDRRADALRELARVLKAGGSVCLLDIMFASDAALTAARDALARFWDPSEVYHLVGDLDADLYRAGFDRPRWRQTARCHWAVVANRR